MPRVRLLTLIVSLAVLVVPTRAAAADVIYAITEVSPQRILTFTPGTPDTLENDVIVTGLGAGDEILGIDTRPLNGKLYLFTRGSLFSKLWTVDPLTGAASPVSVLHSDPTDTTAPYSTLGADQVGIDFNPVADRLRIVSAAEQNLRVNVDTGEVITDDAINPGPIDLAGLAYTNVDNDPATGTTLYAYNYGNDTFGILSTPNLGTYTSIGASGLITSGFATTAMDMSRPGVMYATHSAGGAARLYTVDAATGSHTELGIVGTGEQLSGTTTAVPNQVSVVETASTAESAGKALVTVVRAFPSGTVSASLATSDGSATAGSDYSATAGTVTFTGTEVAKTFEIPVSDDADDEPAEDFKVDVSTVTADPAVAVTPTRATVSIADDDPATSPPVVIPPPMDPSDDAACDKAKRKLAKAKAKLRKLKKRDASKQAIDRAKEKVKKRRAAVKAAC